MRCSRLMVFLGGVVIRRLQRVFLSFGAYLLSLKRVVK
jgi:hypothetical protein